MRVSESTCTRQDDGWDVMQAGANLMLRLLDRQVAVVTLGEDARSTIATSQMEIRLIAERFEALQRRVESLEAALSERNDEHQLSNDGVSSVEDSLARIADAIAPRPADIVDSPFIAKKLGCTTTWIAEMARTGEIPKHCIVPGTGNGRPWRFYRSKIETWVASR